MKRSRRSCQYFMCGYNYQYPLAGEGTTELPNWNKCAILWLVYMTALCACEAAGRPSALG